MAEYVDEVVIPYDRDLGPVLFDYYGVDCLASIIMADYTTIMMAG